MDGRKRGSDFGIRTYFDMFQKMEDTFKFCAECKKLPDALPDPKSLRRCKRYRGGGVAERGWVFPGSQKGELSPVTGVRLGEERILATPKAGHAASLPSDARTCITAAWRASVPTGLCTRSSARS